MSVQKGTIIANDGTKIIGIPPGSDGETLEFDSTTSTGFKIKKNVKITKLPVTKNRSTKNSTYTTFYTFLFPGTNETTLTNVKFISYADNGVTSYDARIYDVTNNIEIGSGTYSNNTDTINGITSLSNLPASEAMFEVQLRQTGGTGNKSVYLDDVTLFYK